MKPVKLITWNEDTQRYEMSLGSLGIKRTIPPESTDEFKVFVAGSYYPTLCISNSSLSDSSIITVEADSDDDEATIIVNGVSHFNDVVNIKHRIDFLKGNENDGYYTSSSLDADKVPNLAMFTIGTEHGSPKYTLGTVKSVFAQEEYLEIPCKSLFSEYVTLTNGLMLACDATSNGTVNFNGPANFRSAANFDTIRIGDQTLDENTIINILNGSYGSSSAIDVSRFVSTHAAGNANTGEAQSIYGGKTFKDETVFEDNVVLENGATVYPEKDISPSEDNVGTVGKNGYSFKEIFTKTVRANIIQREATGNTDDYGIVVNGDLTPGILMFRLNSSRRATLGTENVRWTVYADTLDVSTLTSSGSVTTETLNVTDTITTGNLQVRGQTTTTTITPNSISTGSLDVDTLITAHTLNTNEVMVSVLRSSNTENGSSVDDLVCFNDASPIDEGTDNVYKLSLCKLGAANPVSLDLRSLSAIPSGSSTVQVPIGGLILVVPNHNAFSSLATKTFIAGQEIQITDSSSALFVAATFVHGYLSSNGVKSFYIEGNRISAGTYRALSNLTFEGIDALSGSDHLWNPILLQRIA